jgi:hypothetical protein
MKAQERDTEQYEADFALGGAVEWDELEDEDDGVELERLLGAVHAARHCGA